MLYSRAIYTESQRDKWVKRRRIPEPCQHFLLKPENRLRDGDVATDFGVGWPGSQSGFSPDAVSVEITDHPCLLKTGMAERARLEGVLRRDRTQSYFLVETITAPINNEPVNQTSS